MTPNTDSPRPRLARNAALASVCLLTVAVGVLLAHEGHTPLPSKGAEVDVAKGFIRLSADARTALDVRSAEIATVPPPDTVLAYATLVTPWKRHAFAVSRLSGRIVALHAKPGDRVDAGQVLADVRSQELETLQLEVQSAHTEAKLAEQVYQGLKSGVVAERDILNAEVQLQQARNALDLAKVKWVALGLPRDALDTLLAGTPQSTPTLPIRTPVGGTVIHADLSVGKVVEPGEHLFEVIDLSTVWARIGVLEKDLTRVAPGLPVEVRLTAYPGEAFRGTVAVVGQYLDPVTHLNDVWVEFHNPAGKERLLPGMSGQARIELPAATGTKTVPFTALVNDGVDRFVLVEEASAAGVSEFRKKSVVVVRETPTAVVVRSPDLFPGDRVVTRGGHELGTFFAPGVLRLSPESARTIGLRVEPATLHPVETVVEVPGAVDLPPDRRSVATARLPGAIQSIHVDRGQRVKAGDVLAEVFSLDLLNLQLDLLREHLAADLAGQQLARLKQARESLPKRRLVEAEAAATSATNTRDSVRRRLELAGLSAGQLDALVTRREVAPALPVRATVAGTVVAFDRVIGQSVRADEALFEVHDLTRPWIEGFVSESQLTRVRVGQHARVRLVGDPGVVLEGKVARSGRTFGTTHRTLSVWVELDRDPPTPLRHGQMARLALTVDVPPPALAVPLGAVLRDGTRTFVFVQTGDTFERREVTLGRADDRYAEVKAGLRAGEPVAVTAADELNTAWQSVR
jgi:RND family efflux transporter MFP subunit